MTDVLVDDTLRLVADALNGKDGEIVTFVISTGGTPLDTRTAPLQNAHAETTWKVAVGARTLPLQVDFAAQLRATLVQLPSMTVVGTVRVSTVGWLLDGVDQPVGPLGRAIVPGPATVAAGDTPVLAFDLDNGRGGPLPEPLTLTFILMKKGQDGSFTELDRFTDSAPVGATRFRRPFQTPTDDLPAIFRIDIEAVRKSQPAPIKLSSPPITVTSRILIQLVDKDQNKKRWGDTFVNLDFGQGQPRFTVITDDDGVAELRSPPSSTATVTSAEWIEPHVQTAIWRVGLPSTVSIGKNQVPVTARLRTSFWAAENVFPSNSKGQLQPLDSAFDSALAAKIQPAAGILDDFSLLRTFTINLGKGGSSCAWDLGDSDGGKKLSPPVDAVLRSVADMEQRRTYFRKLIKTCHDFNIQVLAGYGIVNHKGGTSDHGRRFVNLISGDRSTVTQHAQDVVAFMDHEVKPERFDGISFDFEINGLGAAHKSGMQLFYSSVASELAKDGRFCSFAGPPQVDNGASVNVKGMWFPSQTFDIAKDIANLIVRPMAFDGKNTQDWHKQMVEFALGKAGLRASQFQLGLKLVPENPFTPDYVTHRCEDLLRPNRVGLILFHFRSSRDFGDKLMSDWNSTLNSSQLPAGTAQQPLQVPRLP